MIVMKLFAICCALFLLPFKLLSQNCFVAIDSLKGEYVGDCKKGKADGKGTATGTDSYTGEFKAGYPNGFGKYTWKNGNWYEGQWKNGAFNGKGTLSTINKNKEGKDSVIVTTGIWKEGNYVDNSELSKSPFSVMALTNNVNDFSMKKLSDNSNQLTVFVKSTTGGGSSLAGYIPVPQLSSFQLIEGTYSQEIRDERPAAMYNKYVFNNVSFPFRAVLYFKIPDDPHFFNNTKQQLSVEIFSKGNYTLNVSLDN